MREPASPTTDRVIPDAPMAEVAVSPRPDRQRWLLALAFAAVYVIWGSTYLAIRIAVATLPPFLMAAVRYLVAGGIVYGALRLKGVAAPTRAQWTHAALAGLLMLTIGNGFVTLAEKTIPSNMTALLIAAVPLYVALLDWARPRGMRPARHVIAGIAVGLAGMVLLVLPDGRAASSARPAGVLAILLAGLGWALGSLYARYRTRHPSTLMVSAQHMLAGGVGLSLLALAHGDVGRMHASDVTFVSVVAFSYLTVFGSIVAFCAFGWLVVASTPAKLSTTAFVNPVIAVVLGWLLLGETLGPRAIAGAGLIVAAVVLITLGGRLAPRAAERMAGRRA